MLLYICIYYCALHTAGNSGLHNFQRVNKITKSSERGHKDDQSSRSVLAQEETIENISLEMFGEKKREVW